MAIEVVIGVALHVRANFAEPSLRPWERFLYGAPVFAKLLFANLALRAGLGMRAMRLQRPSA